MTSIPYTQSRWSRAAAATAAVALVGVGMVGLATSAAATPEECVPADAYSYDESTYTMTTDWLTESPGEGWAQSDERIVEDAAAYDQEERKWRRWVGPRWLDFENQWVPVWPATTLSEIADLIEDGWLMTGQTRWVTIPAVTHLEYRYTATTGWQRESPGEGWTVVDTQTINVPAVVCGVPAIQVDRTSQVPGGSLSVTGLGFLQGENVEFVMNSTPVTLGVVPADSTGAALLGSVLVPTTAPVGRHTIVATGQTSGRTASASIDVVAVAVPAAPAPAPAARRTSLASTGGQLAALLGTAGALALAGTALVAVRRRSATRA